MTLLETQAPANVGQPTATGRPKLAWAVAAVAIVALVLAATVGIGGGAVDTPDRAGVLEELVELGYLPDQALKTEDIYTQRERATIDAVNRGLIPRQTLNEDTFVLKGIIDRLVPRDS